MSTLILYKRCGYWNLKDLADRPVTGMKDWLVGLGSSVFGGCHGAAPDEAVGNATAVRSRRVALVV